MENKDTGYICMFRSIKKHWIWDDPIKLKWWLDILLSVNYSKEIQKVNIGYNLVECGRGQTIKSLQTWSNEWKVSKHTVRNFLELLKKDTLITTENLKKTTRLTVCNYDFYQTNLHDGETTRKRKGNDKETQEDTNNKEKKDNKEKESKEPYMPFSSQKFVDTWEILKKEPKWIKKSERAYEMSLKKLGRYSEQVAIEMMEKCIEAGWQGLVEPKNKDKNAITSEVPKTYDTNQTKFK